MLSCVSTSLSATSAWHLMCGCVAACSGCCTCGQFQLLGLHCTTCVQALFWGQVDWQVSPNGFDFVKWLAARMLCGKTLSCIQPLAVAIVGVPLL